MTSTIYTIYCNGCKDFINTNMTELYCRHCNKFINTNIPKLTEIPNLINLKILDCSDEDDDSSEA